MDYLELLELKPSQYLRSAYTYAIDALTYMAHEQPQSYFHTVHDKFQTPALYGQQEVISQLIHALKQGEQSNRLILLHGPNGSGKTSLIQRLMEALELYSLTNEGAVYTFHWVFPLNQKNQLGLHTNTEQNETSSYAHLPSHLVHAHVRSELNQPPFLLLPDEARFSLLEKIDPQRKLTDVQKHTLTCGALNPRDQQIFNALLTEHQGDFSAVLKYIHVERFNFDRNTMVGLVTIDPCYPTDIGLRQTQVDQNILNLPDPLRSMNFYILEGDLPKGNRGITEYNDLLKRPIEHFKYLLSSCETGRIRLGQTTLELDTIRIGTCNEEQLTAFSQYPDFESFKARFEFIPMAFLLNHKEESLIYSAQIDSLSKSKPFAPHISRLLGLFAVLTRLRKPNTPNLPASLQSVVAQLSPHEKAKLYAFEHISNSQLTSEQYTQLYDILKLEGSLNAPQEGQFGISPRDLKTLIDSAFYSSSTVVTFRTVHDLLYTYCEKNKEELTIDAPTDQEYNDPGYALNLIQTIAIQRAKQAFYHATQLYEPNHIETYVKNYITEISRLLKSSREATSTINNDLITEFEARMQIETPESFRDHIMSTIASAHLNSPHEKPDFENLFPELFTKAESVFFDENKGYIQEMIDKLSNRKKHPLTEKDGQVAQILAQEFGYHEECLDETLGWLVKLNA